MDSILYHHLGLGDHFICNGIVREYAQNCDKLFLPCKSHNLITVRAMYEDLKKIIPVAVENDQEASHWIYNSCLPCVAIGFNNLNQAEPFDQQFYKLAKVPFEKRWKNFFCPRSPRETRLFDDLYISSGYAILHEDSSRGYSINRSKIALPIIEISKRDGFSMTDYRLLIEYAEEIHVIDSSAMFFIDSISVNTDKLFVHRYARENPDWHLPTLKKDWEILR